MFQGLLRSAFRCFQVGYPRERSTSHCRVPLRASTGYCSISGGAYVRQYSG